ncbi:MAG: PepSY domain-containing protein [Prevotellaceae bacterium]|jgi:uncharacterized iron-regulated membrane protein|nr:PepSY domain-containing protein [Prevotellaceae bacterium]
MKKIFRLVHLWLSVPFGLVIAAICFSGAALVFEPEIMRLCYPARYYVERIGERPLPLEQLVASVSRQLPDSVTIAAVQIPASPAETYRIGFPGRGTPPVYVDPYTGNICDNAAARGSFFSVMRRLHRWLLDDFRYGGKPSVGKIVVGVSTLAFVFIIVGGIVVWIPKSRKGLRANLSVKLRFGWKRTLRDMHVALGIYAALILLALALTGLTWSFGWYRSGFYRVFGAEPPKLTARNASPPSPPQQQQQQQGGSRGEGEAGRGERRGGGENPAGGRRSGGAVDYSRWQVAVDRVREQHPDYRSLTIQDGQVLASLSSTGNSRAADVYTFNAQTGDLTDVSLYRDADRSRKLRGWIYSVHVGSWGGMVTRILTFLAALFGATLPLTGYYLWISRYVQRRKKRRRQPSF